MEERKVMAFGKSSYIVSLPKKWVNSNKISKGDSLSIKENSGDLILSLSKKESEPVQKKITIITKDKNISLIQSEIVSSYLNGYDLIEIVSSDMESRWTDIKEILRNLSGLEIMEQTSTKMVAKDILNPIEVDINSIIRRMDVIVRSMIDDGIRCMIEEDAQNKKTIALNIKQRDEDINRLYFLSNRVIRNALKNPSFARTLNMDPWRLHCNSSVILRLEKVGDRQKRIARLCVESTFPAKCKKDLLEVYKDMRENYLEIMKAYYTNNIPAAFTVEVTNKDRVMKCNDILRKCESANIARIIENLNGMTTAIKYISRHVIGLQD